MLFTLIALLAALTTVPGQQPQLAHEGHRTFLVVARGQQVGVLRSDDAGHSFRETTAITVIQLQRGGASTLVGAGKAAALLAFPTHTVLAWEQQGQVVTKVVPR